MSGATGPSCTDCGMPLVKGESRETNEKLTVAYHCLDCSGTGTATWAKNTYGPAIPDGEPTTTGCVPSPSNEVQES